MVSFVNYYLGGTKSLDSTLHFIIEYIEIVTVFKLAPTTIFRVGSELNFSVLSQRCLINKLKSNIFIFEGKKVNTL